MSIFTQDWIWWVTAVDLPALGGLWVLLWRTRDESQKNTARLHTILDRRCDQLRDALAAFKLEVAKNYASQRDLRALETRLVDHLLRIESKLDATALKAERNTNSNK
ncbi:MAG: hypothetical protein KDI13_00080 [Alphaproteobacteria bacterium]|nr:hypothetical protein [Alphaproteobacteria bacterium]